MMAEPKAEVIEQEIVKVAKGEEEEEEEEEWKWDSEVEERYRSDLPMDILHLILLRLYLMDCNRFHSVSRTWRSISTPIRLTPPPIETELSPSAYTPWLITLRGDDNITVNFYHPIYDGNYSMDIPELSGSTIRVSKDGWLLMYKDGFDFFFNPFTKEIVQVPRMLGDITFFISRISFSAPPTSSDCIIFGIDQVEVQESTSILIYTIRLGEDNWRGHDLVSDKSFILSECNPVFWNGYFYCLGETGNLGVFDPKVDEGRGSWRVLAEPHYLHIPTDVKLHDYYMVENDGDLVSVCHDYMGNWICLFKLELDGNNVMSWRKLESLGGQMLFLSAWSGVSAKELVKGMGNKVYFQRTGIHNDFIFYSLSTKNYHGCRDDLYNAKERSNFPRNNLYNTKELHECVWVEPKFETLSIEERNWGLTAPIL